MTKTLTLFLSCFLVLIAYSTTTLAQCTDRYTQTQFSSSQFYEDVVYTRSPKLIASVLGVETLINKDLKMDIYMPPPIDNASDRPVVILAHGGGFVDVAFMGWTPIVGTKENQDMQALADSLARRGFVTASIEYRTGFDPLSEKSMRRAVWRAAQDMSAAVRFFKENAQWFDIDTNRIFTGGSSAGAFTCLHTAFIDDSERIPESYQQNNFLGWQIAPDLGDLHSRPIEKLTSFNPFSSIGILGLNHSGVPQGVASYWGAMGDPRWVAGQNQAPTIMFHGTADWVVPPDEGRPFNGIIPGAPITYGTELLDTAMTNQGVLHETYLEQGQPHEYWGVLNGMWIPFSGPNQYWQPMIQKTSEFFYKIMQPAAPTVTGDTTPNAYSLQQYEVLNPDPNAEYCWEVDSGAIVSPTNNGSIIRVYWWNSTAGEVRVQSIDQAGVASEEAIIPINITTVGGNKVAEEKGETAPMATLDEPTLQLSPNPTTSDLRLTLDDASEMTYTVRVMNLTGQVIREKRWEVGGFENTMMLDVSELSSGAYMVQIIGQHSQIAKQFIKR